MRLKITSSKIKSKTPVLNSVLHGWVHNKQKIIFLFFAFLYLLCCLPGGVDTASARSKQSKQEKVSLRPAFNFSFKKPLFMTPYPVSHSGLPVLYAVVEQTGKIKLVSQKSRPQSREFSVLLNHQRKVCTVGSEEGLLGLAFSPNFVKNRNAYIYYSRCSPRRTVLSRIKIMNISSKKIKRVKDLRFKVKEKVLLRIRQPYSNHNGGMIAFGPDGYLYIGVGDGGSGGDPRNNGQKLSTLLGKILRIDVRGQKGYSIPRDNPFRNHKKARAEIFAYGLRNPWRFSFNKRGQLIVADVGQNKYEEIHIVRKGKNYGWNIMEGKHCFRPSRGCPKNRLELPELEYSHKDGQSVVGGYFYYGRGIPWLRGKYIFGDTVAGKIWYSDLKRPGKKTLLLNTSHYISSFGVDQRGEIYVIDLLGGIFKIQ